MIQITPQMRTLVAIEAVDGRKGIDFVRHLHNLTPAMREAVRLQGLDGFHLW